MASLATPSVAVASRHRLASLQCQSLAGLPSFRSVSFTIQKSYPSARRGVSCSAKPETVEKVCRIVKKQLALPDDTSVEGSSVFSQLGADSLDTVEIVMSLEEAFGISMDEESAERIVTVQDAADLIEKLVAKKSS